MNWPLPMLVTIIATSIGTRIAPEFVTLLPITPWTNTGRKKIAPNIVIATPMLAMFENVKMLLFHKYSGSTGSAALVSNQTNVASSTAAPAYRLTICQESHAYWLPPQTVASSAAVTPSESVTLPPTPILCLRRSLGTCMYKATTMRVRTANGRLMKNNQRHE